MTLARPLAFISRPLALMSLSTVASSRSIEPLQIRLLGTSSLRVTEACLGTMTWGVQNSEADGHAQLDYAVKERGVNFVDTAELYPVPLSSPDWRAGRTEEIIGTWLEANPEWRAKLVLATKVCGYASKSRIAAARTSPPADPPPDCRLDRASVRAACEASLRRLRTDYIDLYQLHWPDRYVPLFGQTVYDFGRERDDAVPIEETAGALKELLDEGKIRAYGLSNESPYGLCEWMRVAERLGLPPPATIQNAYSLLCRNFEEQLAEACAPRHHNVGLLPWSVLCGGLLSGKYGATARAPAAADARFVKYHDYMSRWHPKHARPSTLAAAEAYAAIAEQAGMSASDLAILWCRTRPFIAHGSVIVGATSVEQLKHNLDAFGLPAALLTEEVTREIDKVHMRCRDPSSSL
jgi:aryl-alcohol dehydrogenase-like predicted oxidoreductase